MRRAAHRISLLLFAAALAAGAGAGAGCKKKKPTEEPKAREEESEVFEPAGRQGPRRSAHPVSVGRPPAPEGEASAGGTPPAPTAPPPGPAAAPPFAPPAPAPSAPASAREALAKAPPELVERGRANVGAPEVDGDRDAKDTAALLARMRSPIASCQTRAMQTNPDLAGTTTFVLTIDTRGVVSSWTAEGSLDAALTECVANRLRGLRFGATESETHVRVPITFGRL